MTNPVKSVEIKVKDKMYTNYSLKTISIPLFNYYFEIFYKLDVNTSKYTKIVPETIKCKIAIEKPRTFPA